MSSNCKLRSIVDWEDDIDCDFMMEELIVVKAARWVQYGWDCTTSGGEGDVEFVYTGDDTSEDDDSSVQLIDGTTGEEMETDDTKDTK